MVQLSSLGCVRSLTTVVGEAGGRWMLHPDTIELGKAGGYPNGFLFYGAGRGGVLGDVDADVVSAAFGYFNPVLVRQIWGPGTAVEGARNAARRYGAACAEYGRARLGGVDGLDHLVELAERVIDAVPVAGLSLFAGWRAEPRPDDAEGRAALLVHLLRELRGSVHIVATTAHGLSALESILGAPTGGADQAKMFGWSEPFPDAESFAGRRNEAETMTDQLLAHHYAVLSPSEGQDLVRLVTSAHAALMG